MRTGHFASSTNHHPQHLSRQHSHIAFPSSCSLLCPASSAFTRVRAACASPKHPHCRLRLVYRRQTPAWPLSSTPLLAPAAPGRHRSTTRNPNPSRRRRIWPAGGKTLREATRRGQIKVRFAHSREAWDTLPFDTLCFAQRCVPGTAAVQELRGLCRDANSPSVAVSQGIFGVPLQTSIRYANVAISLFNDEGQSYIYGYVPIVVAKCGVFLKEKGERLALRSETMLD